MPTLAELVADLSRAFPRFVRSDDRREAAEQVRVYLRELADLPLDAVERAVRRLIREIDDPWGPSVARIRGAVAEEALDLPDEADALRQVDARMAWARDRRGDAPPVHPLVRDALRLAGDFPALRQADRPEVVRGQFARYYREARARAIREAQVGRPELGPGTQRKEIGQ